MHKEMHAGIFDFFSFLVLTQDAVFHRAGSFVS